MMKADAEGEYEMCKQMKKRFLNFMCCTLVTAILVNVGGCGNDEDAIELYDEIVEKACEYAEIRAKWTLMDKEWKMDAEPGRTAKHNSVIIKFNQLARYLKMQGKEAAWRDMLGYEEDDRYNRKTIGDMACFLTYIYGINGR